MTIIYVLALPHLSLNLVHTMLNMRLSSWLLMAHADAGDCWAICMAFAGACKCLAVHVILFLRSYYMPLHTKTTPAVYRHLVMLHMFWKILRKLSITIS